MGLSSRCTIVSGAVNTINRIYNRQRHFHLRANTGTHGYEYYGLYNDSTGARCTHGASNGVLEQPDGTVCIGSARKQLYRE
ncbi:hypothetical protein NL676_039480 [Syzygium grande]|nr:hypothetical protein NL676_039480 [Syzygium grande]